MRTLEPPRCGPAHCGCVCNWPTGMLMTQKHVSSHANEGVFGFFWDHAGALVVPAGAPTERTHIWVGVLFALLALTVLALLFSTFARRRGKETHFGYGTSSQYEVRLLRVYVTLPPLPVFSWVFSPEGTDTAVSFAAARSFNRSAGDQLVSTREFGGGSVPNTIRLVGSKKVQNSESFTSCQLHQELSSSTPLKNPFASLFIR